MAKANLGLDIPECKRHLSALGFQDIEVKPYQLPVGTWPDGMK